MEEQPTNNQPRPIARPELQPNNPGQFMDPISHPNPISQPSQVNNSLGAAPNVEVNGLMVAGFILAFVPILGLVFSIFGNKKSKETGRNRELALIALISSIASSVFWTGWLFLVIIALSLP